jgi:hypothetical protein
LEETVNAFEIQERLGFKVMFSVERVTASGHGRYGTS